MASIRYNETEVAEYLKRFYGKAKTKDRAAVSIADSQPVGCLESQKKAKSQEAHKRFRITIHSRRRRLTDADGVRTKAVIDGLVAGGLLGDDNPAWIPEQPRQTQERSDIEETIIEVWEIEE
jgi:hypothetical protein